MVIWIPNFPVEIRWLQLVDLFTVMYVQDPIFQQMALLVKQILRGVSKIRLFPPSPKTSFPGCKPPPLSFHGIIYIIKKLW